MLFFRWNLDTMISYWWDPWGGDQEQGFLCLLVGFPRMSGWPRPVAVPHHSRLTLLDYNAHLSRILLLLLLLFSSSVIQEGQIKQADTKRTDNSRLLEPRSLLRPGKNKQKGQATPDSWSPEVLQGLKRDTDKRTHNIRQLEPRSPLRPEKHRQTWHLQPRNPLLPKEHKQKQQILPNSWTPEALKAREEQTKRTDNTQ